jgi:hypothetical protein
MNTDKNQESCQCSSVSIRGPDFFAASMRAADSLPALLQTLRDQFG